MSNNSTNSTQNQTDLPPELAIQALLYNLQSTLMIIAPILGHYKMFKYSQFKLCFGPQMVTSSLYLVVWFIYGMFTKNQIYTIPGYIAIILIYLWTYLFYSKQYSQLVYQNVIIINTSYYIRQGSIDQLYAGCVFFTYLYFMSPIFHLYKANKQKDHQYLSNWNITIGIIEGILFILFIYFSQQTQYLYGAPLIKILTHIIQLKAIPELEELEILNKKFKQD